MTEMYYDMLLGHTGLYDEGKKLHSMKEVADFIHTHDCGYIAEADGTPLLAKSYQFVIICPKIKKGAKIGTV